MRRVHLLLLHYSLLLPVICPASGCSPRPGPAWTRTAARRRVAAVISEAERSFQRPSSSSEGLPCNHIQSRWDICKKNNARVLSADLSFEQSFGGERREREDGKWIEWECRELNRDLDICVAPSSTTHPEERRQTSSPAFQFPSALTSRGKCVWC